MTICVGAELDRAYTAAELAASNQGRAPTPGQVYKAPNGKAYKFVQYDAGAGSVAAVAGNVTGYYAPGGTSAGATTVVTSDYSDTARIGAGVLASAPGDGDFCWVQIKGPATITPALEAGADGNALTLVGSSDSTLDVSGAVTDAVVAYAVDANAKIIMCDFPF